jgi:antitoxin component YwqK of YwqJK toxin-antitoxin module
VKRITCYLLLIPYIIFGQQKTSGSTKWYRVMGDQLEINTQNELKKIARENNILFEAFTNKYGFSIEEPLMYYLSGDEIIEVTWWAAKDAAKAQTTGFEQFRREMGLTFDYDEVSKQRDYILNQRRISQGKKQIESGKDKSQNYSNSSSDYGSASNYSNNSYSNGNDAGTGTLIFLIILILVIVLIVKNSKSNNSNVEVKPLYKKNSSGSAEKTNFNKTSTERSFDKEYQELDKMMLSQESYSEVYPFIKTFREKLRVGEIYLEEMTEYIKNNFSDYDGGKIMFKISLFEQMEHIFGTYLNEWEEKKNSKFNGFEDVEQYHTLSQKVIIVLQELLQEQIENLGEKTKNHNSSSDTKAKENISNSGTEIGKIKLDFNGTKIETTHKKFKDSKIEEYFGCEVQENGDYLLYDGGAVYEWKEYFEIITDDKYVIEETFLSDLNDPVSFGNFIALLVTFVNCECPDAYVKEMFEDDYDDELKFFFKEDGTLIKGDSEDFKILTSNAEYIMENSYKEGRKSIYKLEEWSPSIFGNENPKKTEKPQRSNSKDVELRVKWDDLEDIGITSHYQGKPFTGKCYDNYKSGKLKNECDFLNGLKHGDYKSYHENGQLETEGKYEEDKEEQHWKFYYETGKLECEGKYIKTKREGIWRFYHKNGNVAAEGNMLNDIEDGYWKKFHENGKLESEGMLKEGVVNGYWKIYDPKGNLIT